MDEWRTSGRPATGIESNANLHSRSRGSLYTGARPARYFLPPSISSRLVRVVRTVLRAIILYAGVKCRRLFQTLRFTSYISVATTDVEITLLGHIRSLRVTSG